jgi:hypothetical protein
MWLWTKEEGMKSTMMIVLTLIMATAMLYGEATGQPPPMPAEEQPEVLTRGPVNEAFAQPVNLEIQVGFTAPAEPPPNIEEVPPAERPAGEHFAWVPGYWAWDSDRNGYIWVSGCWRAVPPDMYWVPGYWARASAGWQWVAGFWAPVSNTEIEYLPAPPVLVIEEPPPAPSPDRIWVPPCWYWNYGQYILRPGYWIAAQVDWVWVPSHYVWTPRGHVFVSGHWDYSLERRGVLFAPVYFPRHIYERRGYSYPLSIVINIDNFQFGLFSRPRYSHYYYGDYYDSSYISIGIFPWFEFELQRTWYDPIYAHARWRHHRDEPQWDRNQRQEYDRRRSDVTLRPPRTYREMESRVSTMSEPQRRNFEIVAPITDKAYLKRSTLKFEQISPKGRAQISEDSGKVQNFTKERRNWEAQGPGGKDKQPSMERVSPDRTNKEMAPPVKPKGSEKRPAEGVKPSPAEHGGPAAAPSRDRKGSATSPQQQQPKKVSPREMEQKQADRVKVQAPPVVDRQSGASRQKGLPTRPAEEMKAPVKGKGAEKKPAEQKQSAPAGPKGQVNAPVKSKGAEMKPAEQKQSTPKGQGAAPGKGGKDSTPSSKQQKSKKVSPDETEQDQADKEEEKEEKGKGKGGGSR